MKTVDLSSFADSILCWNYAGEAALLPISDSAKAFSIYAHLKTCSGKSLFSRCDETGEWICRLYIDDGELVFQLKTDWRDEPLKLSIPIDLIGASEPHDIVVRYTGPNLEMFVDGVLVDEEWPIGSPKVGGAQFFSIEEGSLALDQFALWNRSLSNEEIEIICGGHEKVIVRKQEILGEESILMQYWKPRDFNAFVGDCMPFYANGRFHLFYLLDRRHHQSKWKLGAHQWAHSSSIDLVNWEHHPLAIPITEEWEGSICTGSVFFWDGIHYAFYATRMCDGSAAPLQVAISTDGVHFEKASTLATLNLPYAPGPARDPFVFHDESTGLFHMLVTTHLENPPVAGRGGCLAHLISRDLKTWEQTDPFIIPGYLDDPECSEYFFWNGWYYLVFSNYGTARYRMSRNPFGPWHRPEVDEFDGLHAIVLKTAEFTGNRRIGAAFVMQIGRAYYAGNVVFREIVQHEDGTLGTKFVPEMMSETSDELDLPFIPLTENASGDRRNIRICALDSYGAAALDNLPRNVRIELNVRPMPGSSYFGLYVRGSGNCTQGHELKFDTSRRTVEWCNQKNGVSDNSERPAIIHSVDGLDHPFHLDVIIKDDIVDACIDSRRTLIARIPDLDGHCLFFYAQNADVVFDSIDVRPLVNSSSKGEE